MAQYLVPLSNNKAYEKHSWIQKLKTLTNNFFTSFYKLETYLFYVAIPSIIFGYCFSPLNFNYNRESHNNNSYYLLSTLFVGQILF